MARGRHRNSAVHRVLIPAAVGGAALACAGAGWLVGEAGDREALVLRALAAGAAVAAVTGALLLRRWDIQAGRQIARGRGAKAGLSWRLEEREAELADARERIDQLEEKVRAKRADLGGLRSEHAALLRRYATAETERAKALEGRRRLAIEAAAPARALPAQPTDHRASGGAPTRLTYLQAYEALARLSRSAARQREQQQQQPAAPRPAPVVPPPPQRNGVFDFFSPSEGGGARTGP
jgi:hypothetical protein